MIDCYLDTIACGRLFVGYVFLLLPSSSFQLKLASSLGGTKGVTSTIYWTGFCSRRGEIGKEKRGGGFQKGRREVSWLASGFDDVIEISGICDSCESLESGAALIFC